MLITCQHCKEEVNVSMYFYNHMITEEHCFLSNEIEYKAFVIGKAICPCCGSEISEKFSSIIYNTDIVKLAIREEQPND